LRFKVVAFDLDGTLVRDTSSWTTIHRYFGVEQRARLNLPLYETHVIDYEEFMHRDISLWPDHIRLEDIDRLFSTVAVNPKAREVTREIRRLGYEVVIVSAGLDLLANKIAKILDLAIVVANGLEVDNRGYLTGKGIFRVDLLRKDLALETVLERIGVTLDECISVGDSKYDKTFLSRAGYGIAVGKDLELQKVATFVIDELSEIISCIRSIEAKQSLS